MKLGRSALLTAILSAFLWTSVAMGEKLPLNTEARTHFDAGLAYADDPSGPKWEEALKEFRLAYEANPTSKLMNNIGLCALNLERDGEAIEAYKAYLAGGGESDLKAKQRKQIETDISTLSASLVQISLKTTPDVVTIIDKRENAKGQTVRNLYQVKGGSASLGLHPGRHHITAEASGYVSAEWVVDAEPSSSHSHSFDLVAEKSAEPESTDSAQQVKAEAKTDELVDAPKQSERKTPTSVYIGLAATGVFAGAATAAGIISLGKSKDLDKIIDGDEADDKKSELKTWALVTDIAAGAAVVSAGVTAYLYFSAPKVSAEKAAASRRVRFTPIVSPNLAGGAVFGRF